MHDAPIIEIRNLSKRYRIGHMRGKYIALRDILANILQHPLRFFMKKAGIISGLVTTKEEFWALHEVNLAVNKGETIGVIGSNGAGKSTLLKILSQITPPTEGEVIIRGRVASLLEVGTGFHPELTGRENVFFNGAILGMTRSEIAKKFDAIVEFAGVEQFIDTPVKYYSSGMQVRLAFSVAAHMEPDILIVDEVLAVGDAEFQRKCMGKMEEVTGKEGRTILFVSHNMGAIKALCDRTVLLHKGRVEMIGETDAVVDRYIHGLVPDVAELSLIDAPRKGSGWLKIVGVSLFDSRENRVSSFKSGEDATFVFAYQRTEKIARSFDLTLTLFSLENQNRLAYLSTQTLRSPLSVHEDGVIRVHIKKLPLNVGKYWISLQVDSSGELVDWVNTALNFAVVPGGDFYGTGALPPEYGGNLLLDYEIE